MKFIFKRKVLKRTYEFIEGYSKRVKVLPSYEFVEGNTKNIKVVPSYELLSLEDLGTIVSDNLYIVENNSFYLNELGEIVYIKEIIDTDDENTKVILVEDKFINDPKDDFVKDILDKNKFLIKQIKDFEKSNLFKKILFTFEGAEYGQ